MRKRFDVTEAMAESAHNAWMAQTAAEGFSSRKAAWGEEFMVPYDQLSERGKEFDRLIVRAIVAALERNGYTVQKMAPEEVET